jgi:hypothetical protein
VAIRRAQDTIFETIALSVTFTVAEIRQIALD